MYIPIVGSWFSDQVHYNEFVESGSKSWGLIRRRLVSEVKNTQNRRPNVPGRRDPLLKDGNPQLLSITQEPPSLLWTSLFFFFIALPQIEVISVVIYPSLPFILLLHLSVIHVYPQVHVPSAILSGALWAIVAPIALSRGHIHINVVRVLVVGI